LYGSIHNQVTYTISTEYFTKFKYDQFGFYPEWFGGHRNTVAIIGFFASWWMGLITGTVLGIIGLIFPDPKGIFCGHCEGAFDDGASYNRIWFFGIYVWPDRSSR
jgi:hypothetical protein